MDYEEHYSYSNARVIIIILIGFFLFNYYVHPMNYLMPKQEIKQVNETNNTIIIYRNITITVTPTPDGKTYFAGEYEDGIRKLGRYFIWDNKNVEGLKDMSGHIKVYDYRQFDSLHIFNPTDYKYYEIYPSDENKKYFLIFVKIYLDDIIGNDVPLWLPNEKHFYLQSEGKLYTPIKWDKQLRIKEIEDTPTDDGATNIEYYGVRNAYSRDLRYRATAGEYAEEIYWVMGGESNAIDGYIIYEIDKGYRIDEVAVLADLYSFGNPAWVMKR